MRVKGERDRKEARERERDRKKERKRVNRGREIIVDGRKKVEIMLEKRMRKDGEIVTVTVTVTVIVTVTESSLW